MNIPMERATYAREYAARQRQDRKIIKTCKSCNTIFKTYANRIVYCRPGCATTDRVEFDCQKCGSTYSVKRSRVDKTKYCSLRCLASRDRKVKLCSVEQCSRKHDSLGYCQMHYTRFRATGNPELKKVSGSKPTHGMSHTKEYRAYRSMLDRCYRQKNAKFHLYGGRGIEVCGEWRNSFENFFNSMGYAPTKRHTVDRIDSDGHYEPSNCRWATYEVQNNNRNMHRAKALLIPEKY